MKNLRKTILIGLIVGLVIAFIDIGLSVLGGRTLSLDTIFFQNLGLYMLYACVLTLINVSFFDHLNHKVVWKKYGKYRLLIGALGSVVLTMAGVFLIRFFMEVVLGNKDWVGFINSENPTFYAVSLLITMVVSVFFHAIYFYRASQQKKVTEQKIIAGTASAKFDALKNQLDPHFLFNSLNVLTSLIEEDPKQAQKFTTSLSKVYRYVLEQKNKDLVSVDEELQFAKTYVRLLQMRFEDSIVFEIPEQTTNLEARIVPLSLQLLLENAVKHNVVSPHKPLHIKVFEKNGRLVISNNLQEKSVVKKSTGVGLKNIQERYGILSDKKVNIIKSASEFRVELPILTKQISSMETQKVYLEDKRYEKAKEKVENIKGFYGNLLAYCIVIPFLIIINYNTTSFPWAIFPALGWGFGLAAHGMEAFGYNPLFGKNWEARKMREYMDDDSF
ncbi:2TM domain-containing protein [Cellulophaga sp. Hel_I_12]|uniref:2TM domain-containing protein n=1 Tax=Cellulophaga sp. Hel_I_12 TaxID=1249972 RepID=UPI0006477005|nr:2TM domain-containing protein [Cellulophaga sp. Hel_I_12]